MNSVKVSDAKVTNHFSHIQLDTLCKIVICRMFQHLRDYDPFMWDLCVEGLL